MSENQIKKWSKSPLRIVADDSNDSFVDGPFGSDLKVSDYTDTGVRILQLQNVGDGVFYNDNKKYTSYGKAKQLQRCIVKPGDIVISKMAEPLARALIVPSINTEYIIVADLIKLKVNKKNDSKFLVYQINSYKFRHQAELKSTGTTRTRISLSTLKELFIDLPPLHEQRKIAHILSTVDEVIEKTEAAIAKYKAIKQGMMHDLFTRGIDVNTGKLRPSFEDAPELYKNTELGWVPEEWDVPQIDDIALYVGSGITPTGGSNVYKTEGVLFIRSQNVHFDGLHLDDVAFIDKNVHDSMERSKVNPYDVLLNITGASIGRCCYFSNKFKEANVNQHVCIVRLKSPSKEHALYLTTFLSSNFGQNQIDRLNAGGNREGLNYKQLRAFYIPWPKNNFEVLKSSEMIEAVNMKLEKEFISLEKSKCLKQGLMSDLLTGKVRVKYEEENMED